MKGVFDDKNEVHDQEQQSGHRKRPLALHLVHAIEGVFDSPLPNDS